MKRSSQTASLAVDYVAPMLEVIVVAPERGIAQSTTNNLPQFDDGGSAF